VTDPYSILRVSRTASPEEIRRAFRELALRHHPDKNKNSEQSTQKFMQLVEAYKVLSDENIRKEYDNYNYNTHVGSWGYSSSEQKWIFSNLNVLYKHMKRKQTTTSNRDWHTVRYIGKATNVLMRKGPMVLMGSIASAARSFTINDTPREEKGI
jgi:DnaJ-class molecular chaperone